MKPTPPKPPEPEPEPEPPPEPEPEPATKEPVPAEVEGLSLPPDTDEAPIKIDATERRTVSVGEAPPETPAAAKSDHDQAVFLKQNGQIYMVRDWPTLKRWISERRVDRSDLVSEGGVRWEPIGSRPDLVPLFGDTPHPADQTHVTTPFPFGGETPFSAGGATTAWHDDDTEGIPTGLPPLPTEDSAIQDTPGLPELREVPPLPDMRDIADMPELADLPELAELADLGHLPDLAEVPKIAEVPKTAEVPKIAEAPLEQPDLAPPPVSVATPTSRQPPTAAAFLAEEPTIIKMATLTAEASDDDDDDLEEIPEVPDDDEWEQIDTSPPVNPSAASTAKTPSLLPRTGTPATLVNMTAMPKPTSTVAGGSWEDLLSPDLNPSQGASIPGALESESSAPALIPATFPGFDEEWDEFEEPVRRRSWLWFVLALLTLLAVVAVAAMFLALPQIAPLLSERGLPTLSTPAPVEAPPAPTPPTAPTPAVAEEPEAVELEAEAPPAPEPESRPTPAPPAPARAAPRPRPKPKPKPRRSESHDELLRDGWAQVASNPGESAKNFKAVLALDARNPEANYGYGYLLLIQSSPRASEYLCRAQRNGATALKEEIAGLLASHGLSCP